MRQRERHRKRESRKSEGDGELQYLKDALIFTVKGTLQYT